MTTLTIAHIDAGAEHRLRVIALRNGRSIEEEARQAILAVVANEPSEPAESAWDVVLRLREEVGGGVDFEPLARSDWKDRPVDLGP